jgi:hypothetical protein
MLRLRQQAHKITINRSWQWIVTETFEGSEQAVHGSVSCVEQIADTTACTKGVTDHLERIPNRGHPSRFILRRFAAIASGGTQSREANTKNMVWRRSRLAERAV